MGTVLHLQARELGRLVVVSFSPLLDGDGVASAPEQSHSTTLILRPGSPFLADSVSAPKSPLSANPVVTIRLRNSLRTRILHTASSRLSALAGTRLRSFRASRSWLGGPPAASLRQWEPEIPAHLESGRRTHP